MTSSTTARSDGRVDNRIENYTKFWKTDPNAEENQDNEKRLDNYTEVVNGQPSQTFYSTTSSNISSKKVIMMVQLSFTNTDGASLSTFPAFTRARLSSPRSLAMSTTFLHTCSCALE